MSFINITIDNIEEEHICCAIADKKHRAGVDIKKEWIKERISQGHVFRKLDARGKVFIEYSPLERAWTPVLGDNYIYIHCLWVSGSFKKKGYGKELLEYCIDDAKKENKSEFYQIYKGGNFISSYVIFVPLHRNFSIWMDCS